MIYEQARRRNNGRRRVLLDSNIWAYVVDFNSQGALLRFARNGSYEIQIAPSVVFEALRLKDSSRRNGLIRLMTNVRFSRLMPEAYSESVEILHEVRRLQPGWLRAQPDLLFAERLRKDWAKKTSGFWVRCARRAEAEASFVGKLEGPLIDDARTQATAARKEMMTSEWKSNPPMDKTLATLPKPIAGWNGQPVDAWRVESWQAITFNLMQTQNPYRDWIAPFVELDTGLLTSAGWVTFWLHLVDKTLVPRQWMRWAHSFAQRFRKVTPGSPADTQLFTYFLDTDLVVSADKALLDILDECRPYAPCPLPQGKLVPGGSAGVANLMTILE
jgi:hypothetical protein